MMNKIIELNQKEIFYIAGGHLPPDEIAAIFIAALFASAAIHTIVSNILNPPSAEMKMLLQRGLGPSTLTR